MSGNVPAPGQHDVSKRAEPARPTARSFIPIEVPGPWTSITARLRHIADVMPDAIALTGPDAELSFSGLLDRAHGQAAAIERDHNAHPGGAPVAVVMDGTAASVCAFLSVIVSGRMVLPVDVTYPDARVRQLLEHFGAQLLDGAITDIVGIAPGDDGWRDPAGLDTLATAIFTSGSTGAPKGCVFDHGAWLNQTLVARVTHDQQPGARNAMIFPLSFGAGLDILFGALLNGASTHVRDVRLTGLSDFGSWMAEQQITHLHGTPSLIGSLLKHPDASALPATLQVVTSGGEPVPWSLVRRARAAAPGPILFCTTSGATEIGSLASHRVAPADDAEHDGFAPVGALVPNKQIEIVDEAGDPVPDGAAGRLHVISPFLSHGYVGDPERTAELFGHTDDGTPIFRSADIARWDSDGDLHLLGRADAAAKIGGYLVAPLEVEAAILAIEGVQDAVVTTVDGSRTESTRLVAHVVPKQTDQPLIEASLRRTLRDRLPTWMVPSQVVMLDALPRNERGKVSRQDLSAPPPLPTAQPVTPTERLLATIWSSVLGLQTVPSDGDFWMLGADSLAVEEMLAHVDTATGRRLSSGDLIAAPTIAEMARLLDSDASRDGGGLPPTAVRLRRGSHPASLHVFAGGGAPALSLLPLVTALRTPVTAVGYQAAGYEQRGRVDWTVNQAVRRHLKVILREDPTTPLILLGHSFGAYLALECAAQLRELGRDVRLVALLDPVLSSRLLARVAGPDHRSADRPGAHRPGQQLPAWRTRILTHARQLAAGWQRFDQQVQNDVFWEQSARMINRHRPHRWDAETIVFTAADNPNDLTWWDDLLAGPHSIVPVPGGHSSILRPPFRDPIVAQLDTELARIPTP